MAAPSAAALPNDDSELRARFRAVFDRELDYVWTSLLRLGVHARDAEDVAQEVFVRVYRSLREYDPSRPIRPWLFAFAFRCASDWRRLARHRAETHGETDLHPSQAPAAEDVLAIAQDRQLLLRALEQIDIERRAVLILYELDEVPMKEIAEALGIPLFTAYSRLRLARKELTSAVRRLRGEGGER